MHAHYSRDPRPFTSPVAWAASASSDSQSSSASLAASADLSSAKKRLRKDVAMALAALSAAEVAAQSAKVTARFGQVACIAALPPGSLVSVFLPMAGGKQPEVDTWPIVAALLAQGHRVAVPLVTGPKPADMLMATAPSYDALRALPLDKWRIPTPPHSWVVASRSRVANGAAASGDADGSAKERATEDDGGLWEFALVVVPCVAMAKDGRRLGHGKGYYDAFLGKVQRARAAKGLPPPRTVGLALEPQLQAHVPVAAWDQVLDVVVGPSGVWETARLSASSP